MSDHGIVKLKQNSGFILLLTLIILFSISAIAAALIVSLMADYRNTSAQSNDAKAFWLAQAGQEKAVWNLKTPAAGGGQGENWTTAGTTESLGDGTYTMVVERWNFVFSSNGSVASASSSTDGHAPASAIDGNVPDGDTATYWESSGPPNLGSPEWIRITFLYPLKVNKVRFIVPSDVKVPRDYKWQVASVTSPSESDFTDVVTVTDNECRDRTDKLTGSTGVRHLRLQVSKNSSGGGGNTVRIATMEATGRKITSTGTVESLNRRIERTVAVTDGVTIPPCAAGTTPSTAYKQFDWNEVYTV